MLGGNPTSSPATSLLYAGEMFDTNSQMYYNRARWYDTLTGRFNRMDPFAGNNRDPQSLHKYLYAHCNPINGIDPSGQFFTLKGVLVTLLIVSIIYAIGHFTGVNEMVERSIRSIRFRVDTDPMPQTDINAAIQAMDNVISVGKPESVSSAPWSRVSSGWHNLKQQNKEGLLDVRIGPWDAVIGGMHGALPGRLIVSQNAVDDGPLAVGFTIYAEWEHDRILGPGVVDQQETHEEFDALVQAITQAIPEDVRGDFVTNYGHGWH